MDRALATSLDPTENTGDMPDFFETDMALAIALSRSGDDAMVTTPAEIDTPKVEDSWDPPWPGPNPGIDDYAANSDAHEIKSDSTVAPTHHSATCGEKHTSFIVQTETVTPSQPNSTRNSNLSEDITDGDRETCSKVEKTDPCLPIERRPGQCVTNPRRRARKVEHVEPDNSIRNSNLSEDITDGDRETRSNVDKTDPCLPMRKKKKTETPVTDTPVDCSPSRENKKMKFAPLRRKNKKKEVPSTATFSGYLPARTDKKRGASTDEEDNESIFGSSISSQDEDEDLDLLTIGLEADMKWKTLEDQELERIERLAMHLREDPLMPPPLSFGAELLKQEGLNLPLVHCAFKDCPWVSETRPCLRAATASKSFRIVTEEGIWTKLPCRHQREDGIYGCCGEKTCLKQHLVDEHSLLLTETCGLEQYTSL